MEAIRIQAEAIIASPSTIYRPGQIVVRGGRIVACSADCSEQADMHLPESILSAGLINAHTHLEFSDLQQPFPAGRNFPEWIGSVIRHRRNIAEQYSIDDCVRLRQAALRNGFEESRRAGVALIGDIVTRPWSVGDLNAGVDCIVGESASATSRAIPVIVRNNLSATECKTHLASSPSVFAFPEIIGLDEPRFSEAAEWAGQLAAIEAPTRPIYKIGISPHAPYSIHFPTAERELGSYFARHQITAMHVAESLDELQWLETGSGPFREVFERLGVPADSPRPSMQQIIAWLGSRDRALLIHGNYLSASETDMVSRDRISIVYCPRTHQHFAHTEYPLRRFLESGINVILGTDSRASNPDLDLWNEVVALRRSHPWICPKWAYGAVTERSAESLGLAADFGTLQVGRMANINVSRCDRSVQEGGLLDELTLRERPFTPLAEFLF